MSGENSVAAADTVRRGVTRLARQLRRLRSDHGVSAAKLSVLGQLYRAERELTAAHLAQWEKLQPQSLTRIIADLDEGGLVTRRQDTNDRRQVLIGITEQGRDLLREDARRQIRWLLGAMAALTETERGILQLAAGIMEKLTLVD